MYTPFDRDPLQFPNFLDRDEEIAEHKRSAFQLYSDYKLAHIPMEDEARPNHYVPLWGQSISISPVRDVLENYVLYGSRPGTGEIL